VSADGYVLDGHHQWLAKREAGQPVKVIRLKAPIADSITKAMEPVSAALDGLKKGSDYTAELLRERMVTVENSRGYEETIWKRFGPNHHADAEKLALVMWQSR
jgi:hypothetical protein